MDNLKRESVTPILSLSPADIFAWEVRLGEHMVDSTPPRLTAGLMIFNPSINCYESFLGC